MIWEFFLENLPSPGLILGLAPASVVYAAIMLYGSGWLKLRRGWKTGYSRKTFHFTIFLAAGIVQAVYGYPGTIVFGSSVSLLVFYAVVRGSGNILFEAMAREKDAPHRAHYILIPYAATLLGGVLNNFLFRPEIAVLGYLVTGFGDAVAEPVGTKFGRHQYRVPTFTGIRSYRSLEGSAAVLAGSFAAMCLGGILSGWAFDAELLGGFLAVSLIATATEAVSPHGWDNFTLQLITGLVSTWLLF